uniref:Uncharacterized protein n=1 Tax=Anopheles atroparvus TaxID=41427 RepID=A0A182IQR0_ANOAO
MFGTPRIKTVRATAGARSVAARVSVTAAGTAAAVSATATAATIVRPLHAASERRRATAAAVVSASAEPAATAAAAEVASTAECAEATVATAAAAAHVAPLLQLRRDNLVRLLEDGDQLLGHLTLVVGEERVRLTGGIGAPGAPDTMDVVFRLLRLQRTDVNLHVLAEEIARQTLHLLGPRGGPHENLSIRAHLLEDLADLRLEAHVQHAVGFVQHEVRDALERRGARLEEVDQSARRGDDDLYAAAQIGRLRAFAGATEQARVANVRRRTEVRGDLLDLLSEFTGRREDEHKRAADGWVRLLVIDVHDRRQHVAERLAGAGLRHANHVQAAQCDRPALGLDRRRALVSLLLDLPQHVVRNVDLVELGDRLRALAHERDVVLGQKPIDVFLGAIAHNRVFALAPVDLLHWHRGVGPLVTAATTTAAAAAAEATASTAIPSSSGAVGTAATTTVTTTSTTARAGTSFEFRAGALHTVLREERMVERLGQRDPIVRIVLEHPADQAEQLHVFGRIANGTAGERFAVFAHIPRVRRLLVPVQLAVVKVSGARFFRHPVRDGPQNALHHGEMLAVVVRLEQRDAEVQLVHDAPDRPDIARLRPAQL